MPPLYGRADIVIPPDLEFSALRITRTATGGFTFSRDVVRRVCAASDLPFELFDHDFTDNAVELIYGWYRMHRAGGGRADPVFEDVMGLARAMCSFDDSPQADGRPQ